MKLPAPVPAFGAQRSLRDLVDRWRRQCRDLQGWGAELQSLTLARAADELESVIALAADEPLTLEQAAFESGFSVDHLGRRVRAGRIPNAGRPGAPRIRRGDLPRKPGALTGASPPEDVMVADRRRIARSVLTDLGGQNAA